VGGGWGGGGWGVGGGLLGGGASNNEKRCGNKSSAKVPHAQSTARGYGRPGKGGRGELTAVGVDKIYYTLNRTGIREGEMRNKGRICGGSPRGKSLAIPRNKGEKISDRGPEKEGRGRKKTGER